MRITLQRVASAARRPARQNWATWPVVLHLEQRRWEASVWTSILLSVQPSASTSETKAGSVNPGATAMEMWAIPLAALVKTLSLLWKTRVMRPNWLKCSLMGGVWQQGGDAGEADGGDSVARRPVNEGATASGPRDAGGEAVKIPLVLVGCEECQP